MLKRLEEGKDEDVSSTWRASDADVFSNIDYGSDISSTIPGGEETEPIPCTANGKIPIPSDFGQSPYLQTFVRCGPHHRAELNILSQEDIKQLTAIWRCYQDDLVDPRFEKKPEFTDEEFDILYGIAYKVVDAMVAEYKTPMVLDQATISNTNHVGHPPHADNVRFDSVWRDGEQVSKEEQVKAAREGAYVLWRDEKTSYRSYSCSVSLCDPSGYEGGVIQFFRGFGIKEPVANFKCAQGHGVAFCGCHQNIHAVTGVKSGFRLVFLVWTRPHHVRVPENQTHVCYFRPGTGHGVWLTTADIRKHLAKKANRKRLTWLPVEDDDCECDVCRIEQKKATWKEQPGPCKDTMQTENCMQEHCPLQPPETLCIMHEKKPLYGVISKADIRSLWKIWQDNQVDVVGPTAYNTQVSKQFKDFLKIVNKVVLAMASELKEDVVLDQAIVNKTGHQGDPPHADNVQFHSVWWYGQQLRERDEIRAAQQGAYVHYEAKEVYRNYCATVLLSEPWDYSGGELEFFNGWGDKDAKLQVRPSAGDAWLLCGCQHSFHAVQGVRSGERIDLCVWTRPRGVDRPNPICHFRRGGPSVWLTSADVEQYRQAACGTTCEADNSA